MPEKDRETVTVEQIALTNMYQFEALLNVLERKGMVTSQEVMDELEFVVQTKGGKKTKNGCGPEE
jgi:hypothetical protein